MSEKRPKHVKEGGRSAARGFYDSTFVREKRKHSFFAKNCRPACEACTIEPTALCPHADRGERRAARGRRHRRHAFASAGRRKQRTKDRIFQRISKDILRMQAEEEKMLELQIELANEEAEEKRIQADRAALEKRLRDRMEMMAANEYQRCSRPWAPSRYIRYPSPPFRTRRRSRNGFWGSLYSA